MYKGTYGSRYFTRVDIYLGLLKIGYVRGMGKVACINGVSVIKALPY